MGKINIISEIGVNFDTIENAYKMISAAKKAQADYVKFQIFNQETIIDSPIKERLEPLILSESDIETLRNCAKENKIGFILTPMYIEALDLANRYADMIKIRYADHENEELIDKALDTGKPLLISVPTKPIGPLLYNPRINWMYCIPRYPPEPEDFNVDLASSCQGFSSHYPHTVFDLAYAIMRCYEECYIEKHVMLDCLGAIVLQKNNSKPIDEAVSITFSQLHTFIQDLKLIERMRRRPKI